MKIPIISFEQPAGSFLLAAMSADKIIQISRADPAKFDNISMETVGGIQREPSPKRIKEIAEYAKTADATFPTPILLALDNNCYSLDGDAIIIEGERVADIVDGQHRVLGLMRSGIAHEFIVPVVFLLEATEEQKALIFATINGKQTKVPASLIYDLFRVTETRSPQKTAHEIARALNSTPNSPWFRRLKMLGKKTSGSLESLSQGTFINFLLPYISSEPEIDRDLLKKGGKLLARDSCIFNGYFRNNEDSIILKILMNVFQAARDTWSTEWDDPNSYILTKTTGFSGIMKALPTMVADGKQRKDLSVDYFRNVFTKVKKIMDNEGLQFTSSSFGPGGYSESKLKDIIIAAVDAL